MKTTLLSIFFFGLTFSASAQITIVNDETPEELIQNTFAGENVTISNVQFNRSFAMASWPNTQFARFFNGLAGLGMEDGLIVATGNALLAAGPNDDGSGTMLATTPIYDDADLALSIDNEFSVRSIGIVEFDFVPTGNTVFFEYVFASEEYPTFVNSAFNDVFGLFLSGPETAGPYQDNGINIAQIPNTSQNVSVNNLNNGNQNQGPCENCEFYVSNGLGATPEINSQVEYNGFTTVFTASGSVVPNQMHHIRIAIGNVSDNAFDSAVFLKSGSFRSATLLSTAASTVHPVSLYPNPASDFIRVSAAMDIDNATIADITGRVVRRVDVGSGEAQIDLSGLSKGTFLISFNLASGGRDVHKLIID